MHSRVMSPQEILLPIRPAFIAATLGIALLLNLLPWSGWWLWLRPASAAAAPSGSLHQVMCHGCSVVDKSVVTRPIELLSAHLLLSAC